VVKPISATLLPKGGGWGSIRRMQYTAYLRWGIFTGLFAILFVPFVVADGGNGAGVYIPWANYFFPYITGKNFIFRILVEIVAALYIILALRDPKYRPRASWVLWSMLGLVAWMALATVLSVDPVKSFWSNFERMEGYVGLLHLFVFFIIAGAMLNAQNLWERFFNTSVAASVAVGLFALMQALNLFGLSPSSQSGARADASFGNATYLAVYMLFNIFITLYLLARSRGRSPWVQSGYGVALVLQFAGLYLTQTRGALLGVIGGLVIAMIWIAWRADRREWSALRKWSLGGLVAIVVLAGGFFALRDTLKEAGGTIGRLASISFTESTTRSRLFSIWPMAVQGAAERPLVGWGQENFSYVFNAHYTPSMWDQEQWFDRAHNQFLDWMIAGGFPAFLLYLALYATAAWAIIRSQMSVPEQAALLGLLAGYAFNNLFVFDNLVSSIYFMAILAYVHMHSRSELPGKLWLSRPVSEHGVAIAAPLVLVAALFGGWVINGPGMARASTLVATLGSANQPAQALEGYKASLGPVAWPGTPLGYQETTEQLLNYAGNSIAPSDTTVDIKQDFYQLALGAAERLGITRQDDARRELFLSGFYSQYGQNAEAVSHAQRALELSPGKQQILIQLGMAYLNAGQEKEALESFKTAFDEAPANDQARVWYAVGHYFLGQISEGDKILTERFGSPVVDNNQLLQMYNKLKMYDRAIAIWQLRVEQSPKNIDTYLGLASAYFAAGDKTNTVATLKKMQQVDPTKAAQIQTLIDQITSGVLKIGN